MYILGVVDSSFFGSKRFSLGRGSRDEPSRSDPRCPPFFSLCCSQSILTALFDSLFVLSLLCPRTIDFPLVSSCQGKGLVRKAFTASNDPTGRTKRCSMFFHDASLRSSLCSCTHSSLILDALSVARKDVDSHVLPTVVDCLRYPSVFSVRIDDPWEPNPTDQTIRFNRVSLYLYKEGRTGLEGTCTSSSEAIFFRLRFQEAAHRRSESALVAHCDGGYFETRRSRKKNIGFRRGRDSARELL